MVRFTVSSFSCGLHVNITPRGAYDAVQSCTKDVTRSILVKLLHENSSAALNDNSISDLCDMEREGASNLIHRTQTLGLISGQLKKCYL